jgi:hypothetical protein
MSQNNWTIIGFFWDEMKLNTTLLECDPMVISNALVSCVIGLEKRLQLLMISIPTNVTFFTKANLCCCISSLSTKHVDALKSRIVQVFVVMDLLHLIMISNNKLVARFEDKLLHHSQHMMYWGPISRSVMRLDVFVFWFSKFWISEKSGMCCMWTSFP